jgi:hypothetical protein
MSKKPKIDHEYHAGKDKMKITIEGYSPSKKSRDAIMKKLMAQLESSPDRSITELKKNPKKAAGKARRGQPNESMLVEIGDWMKGWNDWEILGFRPASSPLWFSSSLRNPIALWSLRIQSDIKVKINDF